MNKKIARDFLFQLNLNIHTLDSVDGYHINNLHCFSIKASLIGVNHVRKSEEESSTVTRDISQCKNRLLHRLHQPSTSLSVFFFSCLCRNWFQMQLYAQCRNWVSNRASKAKRNMQKNPPNKNRTISEIINLKSDDLSFPKNLHSLTELFLDFFFGVFVCSPLPRHSLISAVR